MPDVNPLSYYCSLPWAAEESQGFTFLCECVHTCPFSHPETCSRSISRVFGGRPCQRVQPLPISVSPGASQAQAGSHLSFSDLSDPCKATSLGSASLCKCLCLPRFQVSWLPWALSSLMGSGKVINLQFIPHLVVLRVGVTLWLSASLS